jgi:hypothetical protein
MFYPVLNREYAEQIARNWNAKEAAGGYQPRPAIDNGDGPRVQPASTSASAGEAGRS